MEIREIIKAKYIESYTVELVFDDHKKGCVDLRPFLNKGILKELQDKRLFKKFTVHKELGTIVWENGADIAPDTLYRKIIK